MRDSQTATDRLYLLAGDLRAGPGEVYAGGTPSLAKTGPLRFDHGRLAILTG
ncbi:hypothetical protein CLG85_006745 [Yangia mangrovi]|uniref:Uncharacterized protein n=1 Tax=Alloyangia mangrovi TaxID=1779329 RepID=A0ABT2KI50_9RHOB|nr:hypothetical protein [Alloyangia mangrovi]MCT4370045.1 hypothetical protein [Alloyangia mangrovi]